MRLRHPMKLIYMDCSVFLEGIELTGRYVEEAVEVFEMRVRACQERHEDHLHVYVSMYKTTSVNTWQDCG
jgi:hypothetical protein